MVKRKGLVIFWICVFVGLAAILITVRSLRSTAKHPAIEPDPIPDVVIPATVEPSIPTSEKPTTEAKTRVKPKPHHDEHKHGAKAK
jgi:hypothetical protein